MSSVASFAASGGGSLFGGSYFVFWLAVYVLLAVAAWKLFVKAGRPGWAAIIPIYNIVVMLEIIGRPIWWVILFFIPLVNIVMAIIVSIDVAKAFGKGSGFGIGLWLLPEVFYPILGFGDAQYQGSVAGAGPGVHVRDCVRLDRYRQAALRLRIFTRGVPGRDRSGADIWRYCPA